MKLNIGILVAELQCLTNWQLRVIQFTLNHPNIEVVLISIHQDKDLLKEEYSTQNFYKRLTPGYSFTNALLQRQLLLEEKLLFKKPSTTKLRDVINQLSNVRRLAINVIIHNGEKKISRNDIKRVDSANLDIIANFNNIDGLEKISKLSTYGIWYFKFVDTNLEKQWPIGFWEVLNKQEAIGFSLLGSTGNIREMQLIDTAFFNRGWSITETRNTVQEGAVSVFVKAVNSILKGSVYTTKGIIVIPSDDYGISLTAVLRYIFGFYFDLVRKVLEKLGNSLFGWRPERWSLFLGTGSFMDTDLSSMKPLSMPSDEFWADPFLFKHKNSTYVFFENYSYRSKKGKISCGLVDGANLIDIIDVLEFDYHLSFPFIFEENGEIFLMPESSENERLEIYKAIDFPSTWELYSTGFEGERVADAFFYTDENKQKWLFLNKQVTLTSPMNSELYIYKVDSIKLNTIEPHAQNPVIIDARVARNGGAIFKHEGELYRPSQRNTDAIYGRALNINKIEKLTIMEYSETTERVVRPNFDKKLIAMHHVHQLDEQYIFDAAYRRK